jgi:hypothetical protein
LKKHPSKANAATAAQTVLGQKKRWKLWNKYTKTEDAKEDGDIGDESDEDDIENLSESGKASSAGFGSLLHLIRRPRQLLFNNKSREFRT